MKLNDLTLFTLLWLTNFNHLSAATSREIDEPIFNSLLPRQQPITTTPPSPLPTELTTSTTSTSSTSTSTPHPHNHNIAVSPPNATNTTTPPQFHPSTLHNIPIGDTLTFYFYPQNYSIIQSSYELPCQPIGAGNPAAGRGWFSGWHPTGSEGGIARSKFVVTVGGSETAWVYGVDGARLAEDVAASGTGTGKTACELGLVMVVNPLPKGAGGGQTLGRYRDAAAGLRSGSVARKESEAEVVKNVTRVPDGVWGGEVKGVSDREKARWEGRHPDFSVSGNGTDGVGDGSVGGNGTTGDYSGNGSGSGNDVSGFKNGGERVKKMMRWNVGSGWVGILVVLGVGVFGLGI